MQERGAAIHSRYAPQIQRLIDAILETPGATAPALRHSVEEQAAQRGSAAAHPSAALPPALARYITKVATRAYTVTDQDVAELRQAGYEEDAIFELTLSAALGAGRARLESGLAALKGATHASQED